MTFLYESQVWDLHIHTNKCPKGNGEFTSNYGENTIEFVDKLIGIFNLPQNNLLSMISFTDHNQISFEVYEEFYKRKHRVKLIPGIEIDYVSCNNGSNKHLIVYFDVDDIDEINKLSLKLNCVLKETRDKNSPYKIEELLRKLHLLGYNFLISPHVFKQGTRGLDSDWIEENFTKRDAQLYMEPLFCFWETSGHSSISKAIQFLESFEKENKKSVISFSDSSDFQKLSNYLNNPTQYFHSLPCFKGLALVGTDETRIRKSRQSIDNSKRSNFIGKVILDGCELLFSDQLNTIIGGRGSGKSVLLDSIALKLGKKINNEERQKYLLGKNIQVFNFNGDEIKSDFDVDYFNQAYISEIFNGKDISEKIKNKFAETFQEITEIDQLSIKNSNQELFKKNLVVIPSLSSENLKGITDSFPIINNDGLNISIKKKEKYEIKTKEELIIYADVISNFDKLFSNIIPNQILNAKGIQRIKDTLKQFVLLESKNYNQRLIKEKKALNQLIDEFFKSKDGKSRVASIKKEHINSIETKLKFLTRDYVYRNRIIQAIIKTSNDFKQKYSNYLSVNGSIKNKFIFAKELQVETPVDFFLRMVDKHFDKSKLRKSQIFPNNFKDTANLFIKKPEEFLKESTSIDELIKEIVSFELNYVVENNIYVIDEQSIKNIKTLSPGFQTNVLMEYIVYRKTDKPLLIDQPEDNVDNKTIYQQLKDWFIKMKFERQVIVVTHDANIVINSDANNVIVSSQIKENEFEYFYGALEYDNILEQAATILDGGKVAVRRRLAKYES